MDAGGRRCFQTAGQIYFGDVEEADDGTCARHGLGMQIITAATVSGEKVIWGRYKGAWRQDRMTGTGSYRWSDGTAYEGGLLDGRPHGNGKLTWPEGSSYEGAWADGEMTGQGSFYSAYDGFAVHGSFVRNCTRMHDGTWVDVARRREQSRAARLRIGALPPPSAGGPPTADESELPVFFCTPDEVCERAIAALRTPPFRVPLIIADDSCPEVGGSFGSRAPLWCLEQGEYGCSPSTTVHLLHAAAEKRRRRDYAQIFRGAIREALESYRPFCLVFGSDPGETGNPQDGALPAAFSLNEFLDPTSLPPDLFDLQRLHSSGAAEAFLSPEKRGLPSREVPASGEEAEDGDVAPHPPMLAPPVLYLLRFAMVSLQRISSDLDEEAIRAHISTRFSEHVPLHRASVLVVSAS